MIRIEHLKKEFKTSTPLKDVNLTVDKGDVQTMFLDFTIQLYKFVNFTPPCTQQFQL